MRRRLKEHINASLKIAYDPPDPAHKGQVIAILDLMEGMITDRTLRGACTRRLAALRRLKAFFCGPLRGTKDIHHYCPLGCHSSREAAVTELYEDLLEVFPSHPPAVPAYNKWTKIWPPLVWFASFLCLHDILPTIVDEMCSLTAHVSGEGWDFADEVPLCFAFPGDTPFTVTVPRELVVVVRRREFVIEHPVHASLAGQHAQWSVRQR